MRRSLAALMTDQVKESGSVKSSTDAESENCLTSSDLNTDVEAMMYSFFHCHFENVTFNTLIRNIYLKYHQLEV